MIKYKNLMLGAALVALGAFVVPYVMAGEAEVDMRARILGPGPNVVVDEILHFGAFLADDTGGPVIVNPDGSTDYGDHDPVGSHATHAVLRVIDDEADDVQLEITDPTVFVTRTNGPEQMQVDNFRIFDNTGGPIYVIDNLDGTELVPIGATLTVGPNQPPGVYTGTFTVNANRQ